MKVYLIIDIKIRDNEKFSEYLEKAKPIVESFGGHYLVRKGKITPMSEAWEPERIVIIAFKDKKSLRECFASERYLNIKHLREKSIDFNSIMIEENE
ncbi:MAG: DUF1330 domain-containing protein [Thermodesulfobacteriota bacterium]|jgi:uncharacterized protein (DUF1330 family)